MPEKPARACFPLPLFPQNNKAHSKSPNSNFAPFPISLTSSINSVLHLIFRRLFTIASRNIICDSIATTIESLSSSAFNFSHLSELPGLYGLANVILQAIVVTTIVIHLCHPLADALIQTQGQRYADSRSYIAG
ncbi:hypothetical protein FLAG1_02471 [Fusarium langsethiae]|uniref:Uncharacterized protein n=1 Tax=Fusarium langsethiae TaxID=179993 RepID=A0A0M9F2H3_FUSLA|nr:hypothetical protein FLAG1_02471 [Fusarium langsethiae]GKU00351.1 unnamed protein product [Fusarium langsethiae]GKU18179.1 unnamed protein product [Fusarium langsethiae]